MGVVTEQGMRRGYVQLPYGQMHYRESRSSNLPTLLMLHQAPSDSEMYEALAAQLDSQFHILVPDLPGFGMSDALPNAVTIEALAAATAQCVEALGISVSYVFGHHTGAAVAAELVYQKPRLCEKLVLSGPTLLNASLKSALPSKASAFPLEDAGSHLLGMWSRMRGKDPEAPLALALRESMAGWRLGDKYPEIYQAVIDHDCKRALASIQIPVLAFAGDKDPLYPVLDDACAVIKHVRKEVLPNGRSWCCDTQAKEIADLVSHFLMPHGVNNETDYGS